MSSQVKQQIEFYLSDKNLSRDQFFRTILQNDGFIRIETFMQCNKIKALGCTKEEILEAAKTSTQVEPTEGNDAIRRKSSLPEEIIVKKVKTENELAIDEIKNLNPLVLCISGQNKDVKWRDLQNSFVARFNLRAFYFRFTEGEGHAIVERTRATNLAEIQQGFEFEGEKYQICVAEGQKLKAFYQEHGEHYNNCLFNLKKNKMQLVNQERQEKQKIFQFMGKKYSSSTQLKTIFKNIITRTNNGDRIKEPYNNMLKEILKFHDNADKKMQNFDYFTVNQHPVHKDSRCFFVVKTDGSSEVIFLFQDFSVVKCVDNLSNN